MATFEMHVPQLGEGLQEARIVRLLKHPGDSVRRDEPVYEMETDKAVTEVECPYDGTLESWAVDVDAIVSIGDVVARITTDAAIPDAAPDGRREADAVHATRRQDRTPGPDRLRNVVPPRSRVYARKLGLTNGELAVIPAAGKRLLPSDIDRYLAEHKEPGAGEPTEMEYEDVAMSARQRTLFYRLTRAQQQVVPGTIEVEVPWAPVDETHRWFKERSGEDDLKPSRSLLVAWCIVQSMAQHAKFRSVVVDVNSVRCYRHANIGIAVALPDDELTTAVVPCADTMSFPQFVHAARASIARARDGKDQANETVVHVAFTSMEAFGVFTAVPVVVPPSVATIFLGAPHTFVEGDSAGDLKTRRATRMTMTFDHRVINGVAAANFMLEVRKRVDALPGLCTGP